MRTELLPVAGMQPSFHSVPFRSLELPTLCSCCTFANGGPVKKILLGIAFICSLALLTSAAAAQTFEINSQPSAQQKKKPAQKQGKKSSAPAAVGAGAQSSGPEVEGTGIFGGGLESTRYSRAAETALRRGDYASAMNYAQKL